MCKTKFIAEVSSNHHCDLDRCLRFIDVAAAIGCDGVKFQLFKVEKLFSSEILQKSIKHRNRKKWELPVEFLPHLAKHCRDKNIAFSCTPFYLEAVDELLPYVDFYKISSYDLLWHNILARCAKTGKPIVLSTGMATMNEIENALKIFKMTSPRTSNLEPSPSSFPPLTLLHCVSGYPTPAHQCNLAAIGTMRIAFAQFFDAIPNASSFRPSIPVHIGWSDHSVHPEVIKRAVCKWDATMIEFHLDLDGQGEEFAVGHCWLPKQIENIIAEIKRLSSGTDYQSSDLANDIDGTGEKIPSPAEFGDRDWRTDPTDGLRPLMKTRSLWNG